MVTVLCYIRKIKLIKLKIEIYFSLHILHLHY